MCVCGLVWVWVGGAQTCVWKVVATVASVKASWKKLFLLLFILWPKPRTDDVPIFDRTKWEFQADR